MHVLLLCLICQVKPVPPQFKLTDLGVLDGAAWSDAYGINSKGVIVGSSDAGGIENKNGFEYRDGKMRSISATRLNIFSAGAVNDRGEIVGSLVSGFSRSGLPRFHAFFKGKGEGDVVDLHAYFGTSLESRAADINEVGNVVGSLDYGDAFAPAPPGGMAAHVAERAAQQHGFLFIGYRDKRPRAIDLGSLGGGGTHASAINGQNQIVGSSCNEERETHAFLFSYTSQGLRSRGKPTDGGSMRDLGTLGGRTSYATDINNKGQVVGWSMPADEALFDKDEKMISGHHPCLWESERIRDLGVLDGGWGGKALSINEKGWVVGTAETRPERWPGRQAFLWFGAKLFDLNGLLKEEESPGLMDRYVLTAACKINDRGQIVGSMTARGSEHPDSDTRGFLLTPLTPGE